MEEKLYDVDLEQFWKDNELGLKDNCFNPDAPQVPFGLNMGTELVFAELGVEGDPWGYTDPMVMRDYVRRYNDKAEKILGRRIMNEDYPLNHQRFPKVRLHGEVFGGEYKLVDGVVWLESDIKTPQDLEKMLDHVDAMDLRSFILPSNWDDEVKRIYEQTGIRPDPRLNGGRRVRGPVTLAMSIYGVENTIYLMCDEPDLAHRFFDTIGSVLIGYADILDAEAGERNNESHYGYRFFDDNCCMLSADLYEEFAYPVLKRVFEHCCPDPKVDPRYQDSDSAMGHLLPLLGTLDFNGVNFGPTVLLDQIRPHMPHTRVDGCLNPMTLWRNDTEAVIEEVRRDCEMAKALGRGLRIDAAGSTNQGTKLTTIRAVMHAIQKYGRY